MSEIQQVHLSGDGRSKYVQFYIIKEEGTKIPVFASDGWPNYHSDVLLKTLDKLEISYKYHLKDQGRTKVPDKKGEQYVVVGAGRLEACMDRKTLILDTKKCSEGYALGFNKEHFEQVRLLLEGELEVILS